MDTDIFRDSFPFFPRGNYYILYVTMMFIHVRTYYRQMKLILINNTSSGYHKSVTIKDI